MGKFWKKVKSAFKKVAAVALLVVAIVQPQLIPAIGNSILTTLGVSAPSVAAATAAGSSAITTAGSLAAGNSFKDALKQGATAGVTSYIGISTATATGSAVAGSAVGSAAGTIVAGGKPEDIIRNSVAGGIGAGVGEAVGSTAIGKGAGAFVATGGNVQEAINAAVYTELTQLAGEGVQGYLKSSKTTANTTPLSPEQQAATGAQNLVDTSKAQPGTQLADAGTGTMTDAGNQLGQINVTAPRYDPAAPGNVLPYTSTDVTKTPSKTAGTLPEVNVTAPRYDPAAPENVLPYTTTDSLPEVKVSGQREPISTEPGGEKPADATSPEKVIKPSIYFTGVAPTGGPLSQGLGTSFSGLPTTGLTGERGAGEIESKESGKKRQNVWNEASLRLKDALGV